MKWKNSLQPLVRVAATTLSRLYLIQCATFSNPQMQARKDALHLVRANETCSMDQKYVVVDDFFAPTKPAGRLAIAATVDFTGDLATTACNGDEWKAVEEPASSRATSLVPGVHEAVCSSPKLKKMTDRGCSSVKRATFIFVAVLRSYTFCKVVMLLALIIGGYR